MYGLTPSINRLLGVGPEGFILSKACRMGGDHLCLDGPALSPCVYRCSTAPVGLTGTTISENVPKGRKTFFLETGAAGPPSPAQSKESHFRPSWRTPVNTTASARTYLR